MLAINVTTITLTRGDSLKVVCQPVNADGTDYVAEQGDSVRFALKRNYCDSVVLIEKQIPTDSYLLQLEPSDTENLRFGSYVYDVQLTHAVTGDVDTYIAEGTFVLAKEVD